MSSDSLIELHDLVESRCDLENEHARIASVVLSAVKSEAAYSGQSDQSFRRKVIT